MEDDGDPAGGGVPPDLISWLPDDLLLTVLLRIPTVEAIRTCVLSRRWRTLWTRLPELRFYDRDSGTLRSRFADLVDGALRGSGSGEISRFDIFVADERNNDPACFAPWARAVAPRVTGQFKLWRVTPDNADKMVLDLPCFPRARDIFVFLDSTAELRLPRPGACAFAFLTRLDLHCLRLNDGGAALSDVVSSRCPGLECMDVSVVRGLTELSIRTEQLLHLSLQLLPDLERLDVVASKLCVLELRSIFLNKVNMAGTALSVHAPMLEDATWLGDCPQEMRFDKIRHLRKLMVCEAGLVRHPRYYTRILQHFSRTNCLSLYISIPIDKTFMEQIEPPRHLELKLEIRRNGHAFGSSMTSLLKRCNGITKLTCFMLDNNVQADNS